MEGFTRRSISKSTENLKQIFSFLQPGGHNHENPPDLSPYDMNIAMNSNPSSRSISYEGSSSFIQNPWRTENSLLKSLLQRVLTELDVETRQNYQTVLNSSEKLISIDQMLEIQELVLNKIQKLKQKSNPFSINSNIEDDDVDDHDDYGHQRRGISFPQHRHDHDEAPPNLFSFEWENCLEVHAPPPFDLDSPVVQHIFDTWTTDKNKIDFLKKWILNLSTNNYDATPIGIQITNISKVLRDAFVMLIIPIMRRRSLDPLAIMIRERFLHTLPPKDPDLVPATSGSPRLIDFSESSSNRSNQKAPVNADPFVSPDNSVFDIRIKRVISNLTVSVDQQSPISNHTNPNSSTSNRGVSFSAQFHDISSINSSNKKLSSSSPGRQSHKQNQFDELEDDQPVEIKFKDKDTEITVLGGSLTASRDEHFTIDDDNESVHSREEFPISDMFQSLHVEMSDAAKNSSKNSPKSMSNENVESKRVVSPKSPIAQPTPPAPPNKAANKIASKLDSIRKK